MEMNIEIQAASRALNEGDGAALGTAHGTEIGSAANEGTENRMGEDLEHRGDPFGVVRQTVTQR